MSDILSHQMQSSVGFPSVLNTCSWYGTRVPNAIPGPRKSATGKPPISLAALQPLPANAPSTNRLVSPQLKPTDSPSTSRRMLTSLPGCYSSMGRSRVVGIEYRGHIVNIDVLTLCEFPVGLGSQNNFETGLSRPSRTDAGPYLRLPPPDAGGLYSTRCVRVGATLRHYRRPPGALHPRSFSLPLFNDKNAQWLLCHPYGLGWTARSLVQ